MVQLETTTATTGQLLQYDANFCLPVCKLESERVKLTPFIPDLHADLYFQGSAAYPDLYEFTSRVRPDTGVVLYAVIDETRTSTSLFSLANFAGIIGYMNTSPANLSTEIGYAIILPPFQRTHVATNAIGLLLQYALDLPSHGLGLRRVQWMTNRLNTESISAVQKLGFKLEAVLRWDRILAGSKASDPCPGTVGTDTALLALCWDDWESERARILEVMDRRS
ncbi:acyl-CoA N-acyltransferase [Suillus americanus]|nr:acyl-CoA N-acyltransferase [Suillus americanus]